MEIIESVNGSINSFVWGMFGLVLLIGTGILMTCLTGWFQITHIKHWFKRTLGSMFTKRVMSHTKEKGCAVLDALKHGKIQKSRHESYLRLQEELKPLKEWQEKKK